MRHPFDLDPSDLGVLDLDFEEQLTQSFDDPKAGAARSLKQYS